MHRARVVPAFGAATVLLLSGCSAGDRPSPAPAAPAPPPSAAVAALPAAAAPPPIPDVPPAEPGRRTLLLAPLREAGATVGTVTAQPGDLAFTLVCTGGEVVVHLDPVSTATVLCPTEAVTPFHNVHRLDSRQDVGVSVEAAAGVRWALRIEQ
ncbi:hypothetical protein [Kitasatospora cinereorecta]|uniref:hypothetical protein n=1 Tax=Kitasatospora cinereorecta TaxID=285560 RepID=UPI0031F8BB97